MANRPGRPDSKAVWNILKEVDAALSLEKDSKGNVNNTGEGRALVRMQNQLMAEISKDATQFLKAHGYNGGGMKSKPARSKR